MSSAICFNLDQSKILSSVNGLTNFFICEKSAKISILHKSLSINQLEILSHVVVKQEVEALHRSYKK